ncbi:MAG TPA: glutaminyl-peptide cyclotransferase [Thermoanaerobaculia bacterium]
MSAVVLAFAAFWFVRADVPAAPAQRDTPSQVQASAANSPGAPERLRVKVLSVRPHDRTAYTQGLLIDGGALYESTGLYGASSVRQVDPATGEVKRSRAVPREYFAEGLALADGRLIQLTWQERKAIVYNAADFQPVAEFRYDGEGWGLCSDGKRLVMSDGSDRLTFRDPKTFAVLGTVPVTLSGRPINLINELECVDGVVYANVWQTSDILRIDPKDGRVTAVIDASGLLSPDELQNADVLNGIAWDPARKTFLITGKLWPKMFEVTFVPFS